MCSDHLPFLSWVECVGHEAHRPVERARMEIKLGCSLRCVLNSVSAELSAANIEFLVIEDFKHSRFQLSVSIPPFLQRCLYVSLLPQPSLIPRIIWIRPFRRPNYTLDYGTNSSSTKEREGRRKWEKGKEVCGGQGILQDRHNIGLY